MKYKFGRKEIKSSLLYMLHLRCESKETVKWPIMCKSGMKGKVQVADIKLGDISIAMLVKAVRLRHHRECRHQYQRLSPGTLASGRQEDGEEPAREARRGDGQGQKILRTTFLKV